MKKLLSLLILIVLSFSLMSCDELISKISHKVLVETFTATWLIKDYIVQEAFIKLENEFKDKVSFMKCYVDSSDDHPSPRLSCSEVEQRMAWYMNDKGIPTTFFDGVTYIKGIPTSIEDTDPLEATYREYKENILKRLSKQPDIALHAISELSEDKKSGIVNIKVLALKDLDNYNDLRLYATIIEDDIQYKAISSVNNHKFVFRDYLSLENNDKTDYLGTPMKIKNRNFGLKNDLCEISLNYKINEIYNLDNLSIVVFVQDNATKEILNNIELPLISLRISATT